MMYHGCLYISYSNLLLINNTQCQDISMHNRYKFKGLTLLTCFDWAPEQNIKMAKKLKYVLNNIILVYSENTPSNTFWLIN